MRRYLFNHAWESELRRLHLLEAVFDPGTLRHLEALGVGPGWRCLEVGAGAGSIVRWLCQRVGLGGRVVATDLDTGFLQSLDEENVHVRRHDVVTDDLEAEAFDLIHSRLVLEHVPERDLALKRLVGALAPGGVLLLEDFDWCSLLPRPGPGEELFARVCAALQTLMEGAGYTPWYGRRLATELRIQGLSGIGAEARVIVASSGTAAAEWWRLTMVRLSEDAIGRGLLSEDEFQHFLAVLDDEAFSFQYPAMMAAWGSRAR